MIHLYCVNQILYISLSKNFVLYLVEFNLLLDDISESDILDANYLFDVNKKII